MYIQQLTARIKGQSFAHDLRQSVLITGPNFSHKTARRDAIRLLFLGNLPELGKTNAASMLLGDGSVLRVAAVMDNGMKSERSFIRDGASIKMEQNGLGFAALPLLNPEEYFRLTESERIQYIFRTMTLPESLTRDGIIADLRNLSLEENTEATEAAKAEVIEALVDCEGLRGATVAAWLHEMTKEKGVLRTEFAHWNRREKDTQGTVRVLTELKLRAHECSADSIQSVAAELAAQREQLAIAQHAAGSLSSRQMEYNGAQQRLTEVRAQIDNFAIDGNSEKRLHELEALIKTEGAKIKGKVTAQQVTEAYTAAHAAELAVTEAREKVSRLADESMELTEQKDALGKMKECPHCHSKGKDWKASLAKTLDGQINQLRIEIDAFDVNKLTKQSSAKQKAHQKLFATFDADQQTSAKVRDYSTEADEIRRRLQRETDRRAALEAEFERSKNLAAPPTPEELSQNAAAIQQLTANIATLDASYTRMLTLQTDLLRAQEAAAEHDVAAAKVAVIKAVGAKLKERQAEMMAVLFTDLLVEANWFTAGILRSPLLYHDGEIGRMGASGFVTHRTFSDSEKALTYVAVSAALMRKEQFRLVLLDEMSRFDPNIKLLVMDRLLDAVAEKRIDQVIAIDPNPPATVPANWQVIELGGKS